MTPLIITAEPEGASEMVVPETVMADPGVSVWEPTTYCPAALGVTVVPAMVRADGAG